MGRLGGGGSLQRLCKALTGRARDYIPGVQDFPKLLPPLVTPLFHWSSPDLLPTSTPESFALGSIWAKIIAPNMALRKIWGI